MPLPPGTYPIGGALVLTGEKPAASATLWAAGARWLGPDGYEVIERTGDGSVGSPYAYAWTVKGGSADEDPLGGAFSTRLIGRGNFDATGVNVYAPQANSADITIPEEGDWALVNFGFDADWRWVDLNALRLLASQAVDYGDAASASNGLRYRAFLAGASNLYQISVTADRKLLFSSGSASRDATPLEIRLVVATPPLPGGEIPDNSIAPIKALADTVARQRAWRERLGAAHISAGTTLPPLADSNETDVRVITADVPSGLSFVDISDTSTVLNSAASGDVIMVLMLASKTWVRVGNMVSGRGDATARAAAAAAATDAREAIDAAVTNSGRIGDLEHKTSDIDEVVDASTWAAAPAAEAQITIIAPGNSLRTSILDQSFDPANLAGDEVWANAVNTSALNDVILLRLRNGLDNIRYRYLIDGSPEPIPSHDRLPNADETWTYYGLGQFASGLVVSVQKRQDVIHTEYKGELKGRALEQVEDLIDDHEPDPSVSVDPPVWGLNNEARTLFITIHDLMPMPQLQTVDKIRLDVAGSLFIVHDWNVLTGPRVLAFRLPAGTALSNITNNAGGGSGVRGSLTFHATAGGNPSGANERLNLPFTMDAVAPEDVPSVGGHSTLVEHPRVFHANAISTPDPGDSTRVSVDFSPNEGGLTPVTNSLFTFTWNVNPGFGIYRTTMAPRGTPSADATVVALTDRNSGDAIVSVSDQLVRGTTYLARYSGSSIVILTALQNDAAAANLLIDDPADPITATAANRDKILYRAGRLYKNEPIHFADPTATYRDFATADLPTGYTWGGAVQVSPGANAQPDNRVIYSIPGGHFLRKVTGAGRGWWVNYTPPNWRGIQANESAADHAIRGVGDVVFFGGKVQVAVTYVARTADQWHWVPLEPQQVFGGLATSLIGRGSFDVTVANRFALEANSADITIPEEGDWAIINFGAYGTNQQESGDWLLINLAKLRSKVSDYGAQANDVTTSLVLGDAHTSSGHDVYLAVTSSRKLLFATQSTGSDAVPLEIRLLTSVDISRFLDQAAVDARVGTLVPTRFENPVGASPATLPEGTYELSVLGKPGNAQRTRYVTPRILLSDIPVSSRQFLVRADASDEFDLNLAYNPTTRVLTYSVSAISQGNAGIVLVSIKAIGEA